MQMGLLVFASHLKSRKFHFLSWNKDAAKTRPVKNRRTKELSSEKKTLNDAKSKSKQLVFNRVRAVQVFQEKKNCKQIQDFSSVENIFIKAFWLQNEK